MNSADILPRTLPPADDPFRYGWREDFVRHPDGTTGLVCTPLALEDLIHPEENYKIVNGSRHEEERYYIWGVIRHRLGDDENALALSDTGVYWNDETLRHHSPDISVMFGVKEPRDSWSSFHVAEEGVKPSLIVELTSPHNRSNDLVIKLEHYHRAGVLWYIIVDRIQNEGPPTLIGFRWTEECYVEFPPDENGMLLLEPLGLKLGVRDDRLALFDAATGEEQGDYNAVREALEQERFARQEAEKGRKEAEDQTQKEAEARKAAEEARKEAEDHARMEAEARKVAEDHARLEAEARKDAEETARTAALRATAAEEKVADLLRQLQQLQAASTPKEHP